MDLQLSGLVAVVTGASKGIGLAVSRALLAEGALVVAASRKSSAELAELAGENLVHVAVDLTNPEAPEQVVAQAVETFGGLDILVNNAGGAPPGDKLPRTSFFDASDADWQSMLEFNLLSVVRGIRAAIPRMLERGGGSIVNISSGLGRQPAPMAADYGAAKAAVNNLAKVLTEEFGSRGIRVNTVSPGGVRTAWWTGEGGAGDIFAERLGMDRCDVINTWAPQMMNMVTGRLVEPHEIADMVALLASPRSASTTGAEFAVDAGFVKSL